MEFGWGYGVVIFFLPELDSDGCGVYVTFESDVDGVVEDAFAFIFFVVWVSDHCNVGYMDFIIRGCGRFCLSTVMDVCGIFTIEFAIFTDCWREALVLEMALVFLRGVVTPFVIFAAEVFIIQ